MIDIILAISLPVFSVVLFKEFDKYKVNTLHAIIFNYLGALIIGLFLFVSPKSLLEIPQSPYLWQSILVGFLFLFNFYIIAKTAQLRGISFATFANKMSIGIPIIVTVIWYNELISLSKIIGVTLTFLAIYFITKNKNSKNKNSKLILLPLAVFVFTGILETIINVTQKSYFKDSDEIGFFVISSFLFSLLFGLIILFLQLKKINFRSFLGGLLLSIPNTLGVYYFVKCLNNFEDSTSILPVLHIGSLVLSIFIGYLIYKDKLSVFNWIGIAIAFVAIFFLQISIW
ncbi:DMT family transporter [Flavobacteriales bacterium]|nr:DMT family transporter [Flavobacteriales bacterium]MDB4089326.1 DMT family transporter [Flavobacteriales bacterium]